MLHGQMSPSGGETVSFMENGCEAVQHLGGFHESSLKKSDLPEKVRLSLPPPVNLASRRSTNVVQF